MARRLITKVTSVEQEIIAEIRCRRGLPHGDPRRDPIDDPVRLIKDFLEIKHGNVQLHVQVIVREIGIELRTLERNFATRYGKNPREFQVEVRLEFALSLLAYFPKTSIGVIAGALGYTEVRAFNRFFKDHTGLSPTTWRSRDQALTERTMRKLARKKNRADK